MASSFPLTPVRLTVTKPGAPSPAAISAGAEPVFMRLAVPAKHLYVGQPMVGELQLYLRDDVVNSVNFELPGMPTDGFVTGKLTQMPQSDDRHRSVTVCTL